MPSLKDCYSCKCLIDASESRCPFCRASQRVSTAPHWLAVGITLGLTLGLGSLSCTAEDGETSETTETTSTTDDSSDSNYPDAVTYGGPDSLSDSDWTTGTTTTTTDSTSTSTTTTTDATSTSTTTTTTDSTSDADAVTYGGPDSLSDSDWTASDTD